MLSKTLKSIREGGNILASYPAQINMLVNQNAVLKKRIIKLEEDRDYWIQAHAQQLSECNDNKNCRIIQDSLSYPKEI